MKSSSLEASTPIGTVDEIEAINKLNLPLTDEFRSIVLEDRPLIDVRAPVEFNKGAFPNAINLPLLNDEERHLIGIRYKEKGNASAVQLGKKLVVPVKEERVKAWRDFVKAHPHAYLYCFRGGQRSQISQAWLEEVGITIPRLKGGYKAFRGFLMAESERIAKEAKTLIIGGRTGSGKTLLIHALKNSIDLEGLANHRGSSFGGFTTAQPAQINFEDALGYALIKHEAEGHKHLVLEDESHNIGRIYIPKPLFEYLKKGNLVILNTPMDERVDIIFDEYVTYALKNYSSRYGVEQWFNDANNALERIKKRIGYERYIKIKTAFTEAFVMQKNSGETDMHKTWIEMLLRDYYDPMYDYQIAKSETAIAFEGNYEEVLAYLESRG
ncbi:Selenophosphate-dependent tRNA 2-selenouridine synthase [hydrothermal vent metagenome]|uniref:Selenophosphate-dependent tRNA 2-selenouridine synthase n=1 Tax=hydrothermal vent metagenome TaxID=652676 RepID=A0A1W1CSN0_9ZZZZ